MTRPRAADDFATIRARMEELRRERAQASQQQETRDSDEILPAGREGRSRGADRDPEAMTAPQGTDTFYRLASKKPGPPGSWPTPTLSPTFGSYGPTASGSLYGIDHPLLITPSVQYKGRP